MAPDEGRPGAGRPQGGDKMRGGGIGNSVTRRAQCPLVKAAARLGDPAVIAAVERWHPPMLCPSVRLGRAA